MACVALGCKSRMGVLSESNNRTSFHRFPKDPELKEKWLRNLKRHEWAPTQYSRLCSLHFHDSCYRPGYQTRILHSDAVPTIFPEVSSHTEKLPRRSRPSRIEIAGQSTSNQDNIMVLKGTIDEQQKVISKLQRCLKQCKKISAKRGRNLKNVRQKFYRTSKKLADTKNIIDDLKTKVKMDAEKIDILATMAGNDNDLLKRHALKRKNVSVSRDYSPELKKFAVTLHFLSPKAYEYVRQNFNTALPHVKTISRWYQGLDCGPGFTQEAIDVVKRRVELSTKTLYCALSLDEMAIRKRLDWDGKNYHGLISIGTREEDPDDVLLAKEVLVFMLTCINDFWKIPVGYFFINGISGVQKCTLVKQCLNLLKVTGVKVLSITFDGASMNAAMATQLGCKLSTYDPVFLHEGEKFVVMYDPCHNLKLVRNTFGDKGKLIDGNNKVISWEYIVNLENLQAREGLHAANKLKKAHVMFHKQIMKVTLAAQLLSASVADALKMCRNMEIEEFKHCEATIEFIEVFNDLFDVLNSRNLSSKNFKKPICNSNYTKIRDRLLYISEYIKKLRFINGELVVESRRKTGFVGFVLCIQAILFIYDNYVSEQNQSFYFFPTYKLSQDHIEIFFGAIRSRGGFNNNPSAKLFTAAYKRLLVHAEFKHSRTGNCLPLDDIKILRVNKPNYTEILNESTNKHKVLVSEPSLMHPDTFDDHEYACFTHLTEYSQQVIGYLSGFVARKIKSKIFCEPCLNALSCDDNKYYLINSKNRGGLTKPSQDVFHVCERTERVFRNSLNILGVTKVGTPENIFKIITTVLKNTGENVFVNLNEHSTDQYLTNNHKHLIIKMIVDLYLKIRVHHECKIKLQAQDYVRNYFNKLVLFKGQ